MKYVWQIMLMQKIHFSKYTNLLISTWRGPFRKAFLYKKKKSPFDRFSSIEPKEIEKFVEMIKKLNLSFETILLIKAKKYLDASIQKTCITTIS